MVGGAVGFRDGPPPFVVGGASLQGDAIESTVVEFLTRHVDIALSSDKRQQM